MTTPILHADPCPQCGDGGGAGGCDPGEECLPSDYVAPCDEGSECLPSNYIDPDDCAGVVADYIPYALSASGSDVDTVILATSPWGYWKCDDASGNPVDSSGNGRDAVGTGGSPTYGQAPIVPTVGDSMGFPNATPMDWVKFPSPFNLGHAPVAMAMCALVAFDGTGNDGSGNSPWRVWGGSDANAAWIMAYFDNDSGSTFPIDGVLAGLMGGNEQGMQGVQTFVDTAYPVGGNVHFWVFNKKQSGMEIWIDGVLHSYCMATRSMGGTPDLVMGADPSNDFWGAPEMRVSNVAAWDRNLTAAEIQGITEAILDASTLANGWEPA